MLDISFELDRVKRRWRGGAGLRWLGLGGMLLCLLGCKAEEQGVRKQSSPTSRPVETRSMVSPKARKVTSKTSAKAPGTRAAVGRPVPRVRQAAKARWELDPYLAGASVADARRLLLQDACDQVAQWLPGKKLKPSEERAILFSLGRCWIKRREWSKGRAVLERVRPQAGLVSDYVVYWIGRSHEEEKAYTEAIKAYLQVKRASKLYTQARLKAADMLLKEKKFKRVLKVLSGKRMDRQPTAWWIAAQAHWRLRKRKHRRKARTLFGKLLSEHPMSWQTRVAKRWMARWRVGLRLSASQKIRQAYRMNRVFAYRRALKTLKGVRLSKKASRKVRCRLSYARGFAYFRLRRYRQSRPHLKKAHRLCGPLPYESVRAMYYIALSYRRSGMTGTGIRWMRRFAKRFPKHYLADDMVFMVAELLDRRKRTQEASRKTYKRLLRDFPRGDMALVARWRLAYQAYRNKQWDEARQGFRAVYTRYPKTRYGPSSLYYAARTEQKSTSRRSARARKLYMKLLKKYPLHYYSFLAVERVARLRKKPWAIREPEIARRLKGSPFQHSGILARPPAQSQGATPLVWGPRWSEKPSEADIKRTFQGKALPSFARSLPYRTGAEMYRLDMDDLAASEWRRLISCKYFPPPKKKPRRWRCGLHPEPGTDFLAMHFRLVGQHHLVDRFYRRRGELPGRLAFREETARSWYLAYPMAFWDIVKEQSNKNKIDPAMAYGVMREESTFNPRLQSWSNAHGLMQLIMPTARSVARRVFPGQRMTPERLYEPAVNIALGTRYLRTLLNQFKKAPISIPGYNAGPRWVRRWLRRNPGLPLDEWIEAISIKQTRRYAKRVLQTYSIYRFLYGHLMSPPRSMLEIKPWILPRKVVR